MEKGFYSTARPYVLLDSRNRDTDVFPDTARFTYTLDTPIEYVTGLEIVSAEFPNVLLNVTPTSNKFIMVAGSTLGTGYMVDAAITPGHYTAEQLASELARVINYKYQFRLDEASVVYDTATVETCIVEFLGTIGRFRIYWTDPNVDFHLVFTIPDASVYAGYTGFDVTWADETMHDILGFDRTRIYSNISTKTAGYDPTTIGLPENYIDTFDPVNINMILSPNYSKVYVENTVQIEIALESYATDLTDAQWAATTFDGTDPFGKIVLTVEFGNIEIFSNTSYTLTQAFDPRRIEKIGIAYTFRNGTVHDFQKIENILLLRFTRLDLPFDEDES